MSYAWWDTQEKTPEKREPKTDGISEYEVGDVVKILLHDRFKPEQVGSLALIVEASSHNDSYAVKCLKGDFLKGAWWNAQDFDLVEKNYRYRLDEEK